MRKLLSSILLAFAFAFTFAIFAGAAHAADREADVKAIHQVVDRFQAAVIARDGAALGALFLADHDSWISVPDESMWAAVKARNPAAKKMVIGSWRQFADFVQTSPGPVEERFYNVRVDTNGAIGSVYFDFDFLVDGKVTNRGSESWQLVRADDGWKIAAMLYSMGR